MAPGPSGFRIERGVLAIRIDEMDKRLSLHLNAMREARDKAEAGVNARLERMNEFRAQLDKQAATFATIGEMNSRLDRMAEAVRLVEDRIEGRVDTLEKFKDNYEGRFWALSVGLSALVVVLSILSRLMHF
jgi:hypothetical protein